MTDDITRKRLKKKVLDRWENEGGRIVADPLGADEGGQKSDRKGELNQRAESHCNSTVGPSTSPAKKRKAAKK